MGYKITTLVENCVYGRKLQAEHGLSLYIETSGYRLLFDTGASDLFIHNARLLHIDLQTVDYLILSHGHIDHTGGLRYFLELNSRATVVCKREVFSPKFKDERENGIKHTQVFDLSRFRFIDEQTELVPGVFLFPSLEIVDQGDTHFERFWVQQEDGSKIPDTFQDELAVALVDSKGLYVLSACSHRGITNILRTIQNAFPGLPCNLVLGGFHIHNAEEQKYQVIASYLRNSLPLQIGVCHCTGVDKYAFFYRDFGERIFYNYTGRIIQTDLKNNI
ncbi:MBL fold metallo-hydrolase [Bacteroides faecalis]|uniref:MBL fold hydrolase n=1 Tax=Bacteroides faecalis TaxID=2447885 RepID=A0A401LXN4_9BACE|nr:MBL fold metallo-hydrolase [Bacteroides faecalis]GCB36281.1 MBL fold hydrolase [Bacteroides faecalis]